MASIGIHGAAASSGATEVEIVSPLPVPVSVADGADVALGTTTDAAETSDSSGTVIGFLRGLVKWAYERMPASLGQKTMANSLAVTIASDQPAIPALLTATGTMSATNDPVSLTLSGHTGVGAQIVPSAGTYTGTVVMEGSMDGTNYFSIQFVLIASGAVINGRAYTSGVDSSGFTTNHLSAILPAGLTNVRVRNTAVSAGSIAVTLNATAQLDFTQRYIGAYANNPGPIQGIQLGGTAAVGGTGQFALAQVRNTNPGISSGAYGLVVTPWGLIDPGGSAGGYPYRLVGGRDPNTNAMRQMDLIAGAITSTGWNGLVVRPYMGSDGTNMMPTMDADARRGFMEISRWLGSTAPTVGQKTKANSLPVTLATDQGLLSVALTATSGGLGSLSANGASSGGALDGNNSADIYLNLVGLTGTLSIEASGGGVLNSVCPFVDGNGVRRVSKAYTAATAEEAWGIILPPGASQLRVVLSGHSAGSVDIEYAVSQTQSPYYNIPSITASSPTAATVGTGSAQAVASNANRRGLVLTNTSANTISLGFGATAVLASGITLLTGTSFRMDEFTFTTAAVNAIASAGSSNLAIQEFT